MTTDDIAHAAMVAAQDSAHWAWWTMAASLATVFISLATLGLAYSALDSWKEQERLKIKMEFKRAILELRYALLSMPENHTYHSVNLAKTRLNIQPQVANRIGDESAIYFLKLAVKTAHDESAKAWIMSGHLFSDGKVDNLWRDFNREYRDYDMYGGNKTSISNIIESLCGELNIV